MTHQFNCLKNVQRIVRQVERRQIQLTSFALTNASSGSRDPVTSFCCIALRSQHALFQNFNELTRFLHF